MKRKLTWIIAAVLAGVLIVTGIGTYNALASGRESVENAEANMDTMLKRRADLIPNLVSTVRSFAAHETDVLNRVLEARSALTGAGNVTEKAAAEQEMSQALEGLTVVVENYPELKSDASYIALMDELAGSESRIATARRDYNNAVRDYNSQLVRFPGNFFGRLFGFEKAGYFEISESDRNTPDIASLLP